MPNHVYNNLSVSGPKDDVLAFHGTINFDKGEDNGIIRAFIPFPKELEGEEILNKDGESVGRAFSDEGYFWCLKHWGTKWGDYETDVLSEPLESFPGEWSVSYSYNTAWSPANEAIITIAKKFPNLTFTVSWEEEGFQSCGALVAKGALYAGGYVPEDAFPNFPDWDDDEAREDFEHEWTLLRDAAQESAIRELSDLIEA